MRNLALILALALSPTLAFAGWPVVGGGSSGGGDGLDPANNLCDVDDAAAARVCIDAQQQDDILDDLATLGAAESANLCIYSDGAGSFAYASCTATGLAVLAAADAAAARTAIDAQQESEPLTGISALGTTPANRFLYTVGVDTWLDGIITSDGVALLGGSGAANLAFSPAVVTDWDGDSDPGETDDALNQLAERVDDNEAAISAISVPSDVGDLTYTPVVDTDWDGDVDPGDADDALDQLAERVDDNEGALSGLGNLATGDDATDVAYLPDDGDDWPAFPTFVGEGLDLLAGRVAVIEAAITDALQDIDDLGVVAAADKFIYSTGAGVWAYGDITTAGRNILDDASAGDQRTTLGLGALATGADSTDVSIAACLDDTDWSSSVCPAAVQTALDELADRTKTLEGASGGSADAVTKSIAQVAHGLAVGDWVRLSGGAYVEAQANTAANAEVVGVISAVADVDNFTLQVAGRVTGLSGLTANSVHYLSAATAGAATATEPTGSNVSKPVLIADSTTSGWVLQMRGTIAQASGGYDWTQEVASPAAADWTDASSAGADVSLSTLGDCTVGDCVRMVTGASATDAFGATIPAPAGDFLWCVRIQSVLLGLGNLQTSAYAHHYAVYIDGADVDTDPWYGFGLYANNDNFGTREVWGGPSSGSGTDEWDSAGTLTVLKPYVATAADVCIERVGTTLTHYFGPYHGGWSVALTSTVSAGAGLLGIRIFDADAISQPTRRDEVTIPAYGFLTGRPWE